MPEIIAEIGQNHNGDMALAKDLIARARDCGAEVAKFQVYDAPALFPREGTEWYDYNCRTELTRAQIGDLAETCEKAGIEFMASVFDVARVAWLEELGVRRYKIASRSIEDQPLIAALAATKKPIVASLGMWNGADFPEIAAPGGVDFLYCVSKYPTPLEDIHFGAIDFERYAGFSDHTLGITASLAALARGAGIIEKHFTLDKDMHGPDHACSVTPGELAALCSFRDEVARCL